MERKQKTKEDLERNKLKERRKQKADGRDERVSYGGTAGKRKGSSEQTGERDRASE